MRVERREYSRELVEFLGRKLGKLWIKNVRLHRKLKQAKIYRIQMESNR
jgi:hypothetical protein